MALSSREIDGARRTIARVSGVQSTTVDQRGIGKRAMFPVSPFFCARFFLRRFINPTAILISSTARFTLIFLRSTK
jgi:hypothetical protein